MVQVSASALENGVGLRGAEDALMLEPRQTCTQFDGGEDGGDELTAVLLERPLRSFRSGLV